MIDYAALPFNPFAERIVTALCDKVGRSDRSFFRIHVSYYLCVVASMMRTSINIPGSNPEPVSLYAINLAPSGYGKGFSTKIIEDNVINQFRENFLHSTFEQMAAINIPSVALSRSHTKSTDYEEELERVQKEFERLGAYLWSFDSATTPAVKQLRTKLLLANSGAMNLEIDEIGSNLLASKDILTLFLELFNGTVKNKLVKNTTDSIRSEDIKGITPTNMMTFGVAGSLLDGSKTEDEFINFVDTGYGRRCFFGYVNDSDNFRVSLMSPEDKLRSISKGIADTDLNSISDHLGKLSNQVMSHTRLNVPDDTALLYFQYQNDCAERSSNFKEHQTSQKIEMEQRFFKVMKLAGAYAFIDQASDITVDHLSNAIALAEESGRAFGRIHSRDRVYVKLARYLSTADEEVTQADLVEDLPFYQGGKAIKDDMMIQAIAWGYKNNIIIKRRYTDSIEFFRGETLESTDIDNLIISYSDDIASNYNNTTAKFDDLHELATTSGIHWINHHTKTGCRNDDDIDKGFNAVVLDIDSGISLHATKKLLEGYKAMYYTTKRHTDTENRFRIILPTNFKLNLDKDDYKEFMRNLYEWLPFDSDTQTGQRSRKWLTNNGHYEYTEGQLLDVLPFIPKTTKNEERRAAMKDLQSFNNLERWFINNTGDGNRNNQLLNFAYMLLDNGMSITEIQDKVIDLNEKLIDSLDATEILLTIMKSVTNEANKRQALIAA